MHGAVCGATEAPLARCRCAPGHLCGGGDNVLPHQHRRVLRRGGAAAGANGQAENGATFVRKGGVRRASGRIHGLRGPLHQSPGIWGDGSPRTLLPHHGRTQLGKLRAGGRRVPLPAHLQRSAARLHAQDQRRAQQYVLQQRVHQDSLRGHAEVPGGDHEAEAHLRRGHTAAAPGHIQHEGCPAADAPPGRPLLRPHHHTQASHVHQAGHQQNSTHRDGAQAGGHA
mmetsp:Transcript_2125/g.5057  ORF Transcript_2125/g.5057 Transcript_2125/m.5057 type:complete len:226 (-) Transcript_2125:479-1156(-)